MTTLRLHDLQAPPRSALLLAGVFLCASITGCVRTYHYRHTKADGETIEFRATLPAGDSELTGLEIPTANGAVKLDKYGQQDRQSEVIRAAITAAVDAAGRARP